MEAEMEYIDKNYVWERRALRVWRSRKTPAPFPYAAEVGVEFNPAFEREEKIDVNLLTNGAILDLHDFVSGVTKSESFNFFDILHFHFDLGLSSDSPQCSNFAYRVHASAKLYKDQNKARPTQFQSKINDVFQLPETLVENPDLLTNPKKCSAFESPFGADGSGQLSEHKQRTGRPILIRKSYGRTIQLSMDNYPFCKKLGINFVLRPENAPAEKLSTTLLTFGVVFEMLDFARFLCGSYSQMLKELISHNFGEVYDQAYLSMQVRTLSEKRRSIHPTESREAFRKAPFQFMRRKRSLEKRKCPENESDESVEILPEKRRSTMSHLNSDYVWQDTESSYMCPVDFDSDLETEIENSEEGFVDVETVQPEEECAVGSPSQKYRPRVSLDRPKNTQTVSISNIFSENTYLEMSQKTLKQKEWTRRSARIRKILAKNAKIGDVFYRCKKIGLDFNVGSGAKQNLDKTCLTNHTLFEVNRFTTKLSRSLSRFLSDLVESNFKVTFEDELHQRNFLFYLITKEKLVCTQSHHEAFMNTPIKLPKGYTAAQVSEEQTSDPAGDGPTADSEFPHSERIGLNLWSLEGRPPDKKLDLSVLTNGALFEIIGFCRRLCSKPRDLVHDILEHNFDVDLEDTSTEDYIGLHKWFLTNKPMLKKAYSTLRGSVWLTEVVNLKHYSVSSKWQCLNTDLNVETSNPEQKKPECSYDICKRIGLDLTVCHRSGSKQKLDLQSLTRGALFEVHHFVETKCNRYVPALYEILEYNFDLSSQNHRKVEFAWSIAAQVLAMVRRSGREGDYKKQVFELPFEHEETSCKEEPRDSETGVCSDDEVLFVQKLIPVDIDVEIE